VSNTAALRSHSPGPRAFRAGAPYPWYLGNCTRLGAVHSLDIGVYTFPVQMGTKVNQTPLAAYRSALTPEGSATRSMWSAHNSAAALISGSYV
jgi:hypothetical protein